MLLFYNVVTFKLINSKSTAFQDFKVWSKEINFASRIHVFTKPTSEGDLNVIDI